MKKSKQYPVYTSLAKGSSGSGADVSGVTATAGDVDTGKVFVDSTGTEVTGISTYKSDYTALSGIVGETTATAEDVDSGKKFVLVNGTQGTGSSTYKADYTTLSGLVGNTTATASDVDSGKVFVNASGVQTTGSSTYKSDYTALNTLVGQTTAVDSDVAQGKVYVKADGTQSTGTSTGGADVSGVTATAGDVDYGKVFVDSTGTEVTGISTYKSDYTALNTLVGQTTAAAEDVAQGKVFVNSSGVQTTGTASSGGSDEDFIKMIERPRNSTITVPNGTTSIGAYAFYYFSNLMAINLPNTITDIYGNAFVNTSISNVTFPASVKTLGPRLFEYGSIQTITFLGTPDGINNIAFNQCGFLTTIRVPWAEGEVSGAPWSASHATIEYGYVPQN